MISEKYLAHIPLTGKNLRQEDYVLTLYLKTNTFTISQGSIKDLVNIPQTISIGNYIEAIVYEKGLNDADKIRK